MDCIMIGIAGGTGSGKSTFTNRLKDRFGDEITVLYHDNFINAMMTCRLRSVKNSTTIIRMHLRRIFSWSI